MRLADRPLHPDMSAPRTRERGVALLVVLWVMLAAVLLVSSFNATVRSGAVFVSSEIEQAKVEAALDAGAEIAAAHLIDEAEARRWAPDGTRRTLGFAGTDLAISILDANGFIDLNKADREVLLAFFRQFAGMDSRAAQLRDAVLSARKDVAGRRDDASRTSSERPSEEESDKDPTALAFMDPAQIRGMKGMTPDLFQRIAPFITVYARTGAINPVAAPDEVLASIPKLTRIDVQRVRNALKAAQKLDGGALSDVMQRAGDLLTDQSGPAYIVAVEARRPNGYNARRTFVIAVGIDGEAPFRLVAKQPMVAIQ